jgi:hypothetical protein
MNNQQKIIVALRSAESAGCTHGQLIDVLYGDRADGGPNEAGKVVMVEISRARGAGHNIPPYAKRRRYILLPRRAALGNPVRVEDILTPQELIIYKTIKAVRLFAPDLAARIYHSAGTKRQQNTNSILISRINRKLARFNKRILPRPYRIEYI